MAAPDYDVIKDIPGYKVILKAVLKSQIQQLVEQLASSTDEESVILTASVADGTLSHLGSESGKGFLEDHEDIKSQFLGFCLKKHHRKKQEEKERKEAEALQQSMQTSPGRFGGPHGPYGVRSPRFASPRAQSPLHPIALTRASPGAHIRSPGVRHEPYPMARPRMKRTSLNFEHGKSATAGPSQTSVKSPMGNKIDGQVIKIEPDEDNEGSNHSESDTVNQDKPASTSQSPSHPSNAPPSVKSESGDKDDDAKSESSSSTIPNEPPSEALGLDSDLSNLISESNQPQTSETSEIDPNVSVKLEALTENEMELEITGVEPGRPPMPQDNWDPNVSMGMNFDPTGATGSQGDMEAQGYNMSSVAGPTVQNQYGQYIEMHAGGLSEITTQFSSTSHFLQSDIRRKPLTEYSDLIHHVAQMSPLPNQAMSQNSAGSATLDRWPAVTMATEETDLSEASDPQHPVGANRKGDGQLVCPYKDCGKVFSWKYTLNRHLKNHDGQKMFQCSYCDMKCARKDNLKVHIYNIHKKHFFQD